MELVINDYNKRTYCSAIDGLKDTERKVLFTALKLNSQYSTNQLMEKTLVNTEYYHGEESLRNVIFSMMKEKTHNLNVLLDCNNYLKSSLQKYSGRCGTITCLNPIIRQLFLEEDFEVLDYEQSEGLKYEPSFYVPLVPLVLIDKYYIVEICGTLLRKINGATLCADDMFEKPMQLLNSDGNIKQYSSFFEILDEFYKVRIELYKKRKNYLQHKLNNEILKIKNQMRFIEYVSDGHIKLQSITNLNDVIKTLSFDLIDGSYKYLTLMNISQFTDNYYLYLNDMLYKKSQELNNYTTLSPEEIYCYELKSFLDFYDKKTEKLSQK
jgi:hypothetical protein